VSMCRKPLENEAGECCESQSCITIQWDGGGAPRGVADIAAEHTSMSEYNDCGPRGWSGVAEFKVYVAEMLNL